MCVEREKYSNFAFWGNPNRFYGIYYGTIQTIEAAGRHDAV